MLTSPKLMDPLQMALGIRGSIPNLSWMQKGTPVRRLISAGLIGALLLAAACSDDGGGGSADSTTTTEDTSPRLDQVQLLASHNSTHIQGPQALLDAITAALPALTPTIE